MARLGHDRLSADLILDGTTLAATTVGLIQDVLLVHRDGDRRVVEYTVTETRYRQFAGEYQCSTDASFISMGRGPHP